MTTKLHPSDPHFDAVRGVGGRGNAWAQTWDQTQTFLSHPAAVAPFLPPL